MSKSLLPVVAAAIALSAGAVSSTAVLAADAPNVSKAAGPTLKSANDAYQAKNWAECVKKAQEALAVQGKNPYDVYVANQLLAPCQARLGNNSEAAAALEAQLDSGFMPANQVNPTLKNLAVIAYQNKNYPKAVDLGNRLIKNGAGDEEIYTVVGQGMYLQNKFSEAAKFFADYIEGQERKGQQPKEQTLTILRSAYERGNNSVGATDALEKMVVYYPKKDYWNNLMYTLRRMPKMTDRQTLQVYRLMMSNKTMQACSDYSEMAELAVSGGNPGEALSVTEQGIASGLCTEQRDKDRMQRMLESVKKSSAADQASLPKLEAEAKNAKTGDVDVALGNAYMSYGQNDKAIDALTRGLTRGGLKNPADAQLTLGVAQARAGDKAAALRSFRAVKTDDMVYMRLAKLWSLHVQ